VADIRVRVVAAADPSLRSAFKPLEESADAAAKKVRGLSGAGRAAGQEMVKNAREKIRAAKDAQAEVERFDARASAARMRQGTRDAQESRRSVERQTRDELRIKERAQRDELKMFDQRLRARQTAARAEEREVLRSVASTERAQERAQNRKQNQQTNQLRSDRRAMAQDFGSGITRNLSQVGRAGMSVAGEYARGAGVDLSLANTFGRGNKLQSTAVNLSNQGVNTAGGVERIGADKIEARIREVADSSGMDRGAIGAGLEKQVSKTGDLEGALATSAELAKLAKVNNADFGDMASAAGEVANALGDVGEMADKAKKAEKVAALMKTFAFQGKLGAVEIKDMASQMSKLGAAASAFEGDAGDNLETMGALVQMAKKTGGASGATQAATSIAGFANVFKTTARANQFEKITGKSAFNDQGQVRDPMALMKEALSATRDSDPTEFKRIFANVVGAKPAEAIKKTYQEAYLAAGGRKGGAAADKAALLAVDKEVNSYKPSTEEQRTGMDADIESSFKLSMGTTETKAQLLQNRLDDVAVKLSERLAPAVEKLVPHLESFANKMADAVAWAADNPGKAIALAITASIGQAAIGTAVRASMEGLLRGVLSGGGVAGAAGGKPGIGAGLGAMGNLAAGLTIAATAVTVTAAGIALIDAAFDSSDEKDRRAYGSEMDRMNQRSESSAKTRMGTATADDVAALNAQYAELEAKIASGEKATKAAESPFYGTTSAISGIANFVAGGGDTGTSFDAQAVEDENAKKLADNKAELAAVKASIDAMVASLNGGLKISSMPAQPGASGGAGSPRAEEP